MQTMTRWTVAMIIVMAGFFSLPQSALAQDGTKIHSSAMKGLEVDGWQMILPEIVEEDDGRMWLRHTLPDGSYQSLPFKAGDPLTMKWFKPGYRGASDYPAGWSIEDTQAVVDWHMSGGKGDYVIEGGEWKEVDPSSAPSSAPSSTPSTPSTSSTSSTDDNCSGPYCDRPVTGVQSVSTADDPGNQIIPPPPTSSDSNPITELNNRVLDARRKCLGKEPNSSECQEYEKLYKEYIQASGG